MEILMYLIIFVIIFYQSFVTTQSSTIDMCDSSNSNNSFIYCSGEILTAVNLFGGLFNDSKHFVDMPLKADPALTRAEFITQFPNASQINSTDLRRFIDKYFSEPGSELTDCTPTDWQPNPPKLMAINDSRLRDWALRLHAIWKRLCKQMDPDVGIHPERYSLIHVPNHYIAPGGRYREFYYWDAYWIVKGLIASDMLNTTRAMILNLAHMVDKYGFVPNGGRVYYLRRSQPPLLMPMLYEYYESTHDIAFVKSLISTMERELMFWTKQRNIDVQIDSVNYTVYRYCTPTNVPRPESFREDVLNALNTDESTKYWQNIASAAESGWDFSSRWFADQMTLETIETTNILPIDLNAYICWNMGIFEYFYRIIGNIEKADEFALQRAKLRHTIDAVFYNTTLGSWYDYNLRTRQHNTAFYLSMAVPLFAGCYENLSLQKSFRLFQLMKNSGAFYYPGGVPTSLIRNTNEQWDFPNGWSPLNHMLIEGLRKSANAQMQQKAFDLAQKWVSSNYRVFMATDAHMWEKYDVSGTVPKPGAGGEYQVQDGFGWTNGVILDLLVTYNERLTVPSVSSSSWSSRSRTELEVAVLLLLLMIV